MTLTASRLSNGRHISDLSSSITTVLCCHCSSFVCNCSLLYTNLSVQEINNRFQPCLGSLILSTKLACTAAYLVFIGSIPPLIWLPPHSPLQPPIVPLYHSCSCPRHHSHPFLQLPTLPNIGFTYHFNIAHYLGNI